MSKTFDNGVTGLYECGKCHSLVYAFDFILGADLCRDCYDTREDEMEEYEGDINDDPPPVKPN